MRLEYFQMLDDIEELNTERAELVGRAHVPHTSPVLDGHFPGLALLPGVLLLEVMAQASGYLLLAMNGFSRMPFLASVKEVNFRSFVRPGSTLIVRARRIHDGSGFAVTEASIERDGARVSDARLTLRSVNFPSPTVERHVTAEGQRLGLLEATGAA